MLTNLHKIVRDYVVGDRITPNLPRSLRAKALLVGAVLGLWLNAIAERLLG